MFSFVLRETGVILGREAMKNDCWQLNIKCWSTIGVFILWGKNRLSSVIFTTDHLPLDIKLWTLQQPLYYYQTFLNGKTIVRLNGFSIRIKIRFSNAFLTVYCFTVLYVFKGYSYCDYNVINIINYMPMRVLLCFSKQSER